MNSITSIDYSHILTPVLDSEDARAELELIDPLTVTAVKDVIERAKLVADRAKVPLTLKGDIAIDTLVRRQIQAGLEQGTY